MRPSLQHKPDGMSGSSTSLESRVAVLCLMSRSAFAAILLPWFVIGGLTKVGGLSMSMGPTVDGLPLALGAYYAYVPDKIGALNASQPSFDILTQVYVGLMVLLEVALPVLIVLGMLARFSVVLLALHQIIVFTLNASNADFGAPFDASPFDMFPDQLLLWVMLMAPLALFGAGPFSGDDALDRWKDRRG